MQTPPFFSIVIPVYNEAENIGPMVREIQAAFAGRAEAYEVIFVDDASSDDSPAVLQRLTLETGGMVRSLRHRRNFGQSAAVATGFRAARGEWIGTLDGDGQNDPADLPHMLDEALRLGVDCVTGVRAKRQDNFIRKLSSRVGNGFRNWATGDRVSDSGCGVRVVRAACVRELPVFNGLHRFMPTLLRTKGYSVAERSVNHRPRLRGVSKYGVHNRLWRGIRDCFGVRWFAARGVPAERVDGIEGGAEQGPGR
ncbi:MAG: Dodecaprenyl-phosphate galacturonate synthase [Rhodocyclaceae bacterium]|nr:MAG: glycosyltransferase family 2 protein [Rhodocyclaceae bacterium]MBE7422485.1 glycosyltransferase family 2 protein [Zoogloeaceae bacterium]MBV6409026.1 Dodecaprenyl-phosphate galacturonate synthase [Rhodocyclaceae bacterium]MCK6382844.1 glycosyltransferase family 2 protein [Rhodocyclaceae bacterium]CAG0927663.1 dolichol-phosphate mannosyltransferase [Rhodocyclaceae bacterium]